MRGAYVLDSNPKLREQQQPSKSNSSTSTTHPMHNFDPEKYRQIPLNDARYRKRPALLDPGSSEFKSNEESSLNSQEQGAANRVLAKLGVSLTSSNLNNTEPTQNRFMVKVVDTETSLPADQATSQGG